VYRSFLKNVFQKAGAVPLPVAVPGNLALTASSLQWAQAGQFDLRLGVPTLTDMGYSAELKQQSAFLGGESEALLRLKTQMKRTQWVQQFEKPKTSPNSLTPSTTVLSPYLKFGCLSVRTFYHELLRVPKPKTQPPVSLEGQLLWREFYYASAYLCPNYDQMQDNPICRNIPWREVIVPPTTTSAVREKVDAQSAHAHLQAWQQGRTGFPYIDAIMTQLNTEGWIHHLARHSVACFLTRGDLFISWEHGARYFDKELLDADWSLNNGNWMWLSASCYFYQYFRCYSPIKFGQKTDKTGAYIRKWVPQLRDMPAKYIYEPWTAPLHVQEASGCVIGQDYPAPIVDHRVVSKRNMQWMKTAYEQYKTKSKSAAKATTGAKRKLSTTTASKQRKPRKKGKVQAKLKF
jgi:cryptochrome